MASLAGCGTFLHPERRGQRCGPIDWKIAALDGLGLLFFFIPGVIAFAVDFSNGTIYLPSEECTSVGKKSRRLRQVHLPKDELSSAKIEEIVSRETGHSIRLNTDAFETRKLQTIDEFWETQHAFGDA